MLGYDTQPMLKWREQASNLENAGQASKVHIWHAKYENRRDYLPSSTDSGPVGKSNALVTYQAKRNCDTKNRILPHSTAST